MSAKMKFYERVGRKVKEIREKCGESVQDLSNSSGLSENAIKSIESGKRDIKISELFEISKALNVRISAFLNPCDYQLYNRRKEEAVECYVSLPKISELLDISETFLKELCMNDEIPFEKISSKYFFRSSEINKWLKHHLGIKKKIKKNERKIVKIYDIEPLISTREAASLLGCPRDFIYKLRETIPYYRIGGRYKFKVTDIENYREKQRVDFWQISSRIGTWKSSFVSPESTWEQKMVRAASYERRYNERSRPGYIVREKNIKSPYFEDLKQKVEEFIKASIRVKSNVLECDYYIIDRLKLYGCHLKWWGLPEGREDYRIHSTGLNSESPEELREKVDKILKRIQKEDLIDVDYYTWHYSWDNKPHHARIIYYLPKKTN